MRRLTLRNAQVSYTGSAINGILVGSLAGSSGGTIMAVSVIGGTVTGGDGDNGDSVGGLVGATSAKPDPDDIFSGSIPSTIISSHASSRVEGGNGNEDHVGGLVGSNRDGTITDSYASGAVNGGDGDFDRVGGLVGSNRIRIYQHQPSIQLNYEKLCQRRCQWR